MKKVKEYISKITNFIAKYSAAIILFLWILAFVIPLIFKPRTPDRFKKDQLDYYEISFLAASALFTGIAFAVTFSSLIDQKKNLREQTDILRQQVVVDVFSKTSKNLKEKQFLKSRRYIGSKEYNDDINLFCSIIQKDNINIEDIKTCLKELKNNVDKQTKKRLSNSYYSIISFCSRMEYIGFLHEQISSPILLSYYGRTIITTYRILKPIIEIERENNRREYLFFHFSLLYYSALKEEARYLAEKARKIKMFDDMQEEDIYSPYCKK